jgi:hypothetical protein
MIFTGFKRKSNQIFFNKRVVEVQNNSNNISSEKVKKILIFLDDGSEKDQIKRELLALFQVSENDLRIVVFSKSISKDQVTEEIITPKDFGWYGKVKSEKLKNILTNTCDLLINYSKVDNIYTNTLLLQYKAAFKVGFSHLDNRLYDLLISCNSTDISLFNKELKKYLKILGKI